MDGLHLFKEPSHPAKPIRIPTSHRHARHLERYQSPRPLKYYYIDFESSIRFETRDDRQRIRRNRAQDKTVPEEKAEGLCDPFAIDVYCVGNLVIQHWLPVSRTSLSLRIFQRLQAYRNVDFIRSLAEDMTHPDPGKRPTADQVVARFADICASLSEKQLRKPLVRVPEFHSPELVARRFLANYDKADDGMRGAHSKQPRRRDIMHVLFAALRRRRFSSTSNSSDRSTV